ncbi:MAG: ABC transporter ATP-binding protein/permease [Defluviitaleaceae bacterium]|nr:ABC transporter ATP-binding protein/permease [Defluviitaleaceae bacterium]
MSDKISVKEAARLTMKGYKIWWDKFPRYFVSTGLWCMVSALTPYVGIYLAAQIINEIAGARDPQRLRFLVLAALISAAVLGLITAGLSRWRRCYYGSWMGTMWYRHQSIFSQKLLSMDFSDVDSTKVREQLGSIMQNAQWGNQWGMLKLLPMYQDIISAFFKIAGAVALSVSLFTLPIPAQAGAITILNHPIFVVLIIALLLAATFIAPMLANHAQSFWVKALEHMTIGNRLFVAFANFSGERKRAMDVRMYEQERFPRHYITDNEDGIFTVRGVLAKVAAGSMGVFLAASAAVGHVFTAIIYIFVCLKAWGGAFGVGSVTQYVGAVTALSSGVSTMVLAMGDMRNNAPFLQDIFSLLELPNSMYQGSLTTEKRSDNKYEITFKNVSFKYPGAEKYALRNINLTFTVGERLAIVGENGSGKTTFIKLLCRLYDPTEGEILLNGFDIRKYDYRQYMDIFTVMFQDFQLLSVPLGQNVAAAAEYDAEKAAECLLRAGFDPATLPKGLETCLYKDFEDDGVDISGGEAQKIALARAIYRKAPFVILDEPTAALDPVAEFEIYSKMNDIVGDKTAVFISHRLSSCRFCQDIAVFHEGELVQRGNHERLMGDAAGKYGELWNAQAQYYQDEV